ncbi:PREDICTED: methylmalonic aciduria and homocystinuria type D homolog, mitochondrial [Dufourea novaeangliae]|uniref:methylmalonic aciduria and homocystinuria type D homolog, mitochondrial n=1 Tax=Dufourea novaeangliae TaxID=178035 RepID=UPI000767D8EB|nr:PREDICTED: methylmalonic aciduria and homocystinuria type D homolog, mitochondrial [Dufourea novaeangliae]XP_015435448.1 PREDICTED: methylmalonic aciduria and homocystinuria type D homolog, mitochondrial [Dufourea novaeangliae]XP_015435449.1 PREDICTED: methylmalonic aciduria and homocystinuria type D homolog, mitochondrial [Dufourea novaeangliae]
MFCVKYARSVKPSPLFNFLPTNRYSRRSDKNTSTYKVVKSSDGNLDDMDGAVLGINSNWELLTPNGFRFYLPGSVGPGWSDVTTTAQRRSHLLDISNNNEQVPLDYTDQRVSGRLGRSMTGQDRTTLRCVAQECPLLLRKGIEELFPGCLDVGSPQLTIITVCQKTNSKTSRWSREMEMEELAKYFVLAASDICTKLKMIGYWADFINPFSGQPHLSVQKNSTLYKTDERFRCLGFKIVHKNNCKVILYDNNGQNFIGSLYTTAPASTAFLKEILYDCEHVNLNEA